MRTWFKTTLVFCTGVFLGGWVIYDTNHRMHYAWPGFGFVCRANDLEAVAYGDWSRDTEPRVMCVDMSNAIPEKDLLDDYLDRLQAGLERNGKTP